MPSTRLKARTYSRVSRLGDGRSTQDQDRECLAWCEREDVEVVRSYCDDGISASRFGGPRPDWERLKNELKPGELLVVWEASRTQRDLEEFVALRNLCAGLNVKLCYSGKILDLTLGDDRFTAGLDALLSERESEILRLRVLRGMRGAAEKGLPHGRAPWGYRAVGRGQWEPDPIEAPRVIRAVERLIDGETGRMVLRDLQCETEFYSPSNIASFHRAVTNPALVGLRSHHGKMTVGIWQPLITEGQRNELLLRKKRNKLLYGYESNPGPEPKYLLSGIAKCGVCGNSLYMRVRHDASHKPTYLCKAGHVHRIAEPLEQQVLQRIFREAREIQPGQFKEADVAKDISAIDDEIIKLADKLENFATDAIATGMSASLLAKVERRTEADIAKLEDKKARLVPIGENAFPTDLILESWDELTLRQKRDIIRKNFAITVKKVPRGNALPGDVTIEKI